jgi:hypothetical protein
MKYPGVIFLFTLALLLSACRQAETSSDQRATIDSLKQTIEFLKPGLGEFMVQLELHEERLGKGIQEKNFERVAFEIDEMSEVVEKVEQLKITNDKLKGSFSDFYKKYLNFPLDSLKASAGRKDEQALQNHLITLVTNCNSCHQENSMSFLKINY